MMGTGKNASSGLPELDELVHGIWVGDNVVFETTRLDDYRRFVTPFAEWAERAGRRLVYFRFAGHSPLLPDAGYAEVHELDPMAGFESFLGAIYDAIQAAGRGACYVFDCLSDLAADWFSDAMLGNFFRLTCPYLYDMETIAYFSLVQNRHSMHAITPIKQTTQIYLDVYSHQDKVFVRPVKIQMRHTQTLALFHEWRDHGFVPVHDSCTISEILNSARRSPLEAAIGGLDIWHRTFLAAEEQIDDNASDAQCEMDEQATCGKLLRMIVSRDDRMLRLAERFFTIEDVLKISRRTIGTGLIGGKSVGMLLARSILGKTSSRLRDLLEMHDSFYIASDVFFSYLVRNGSYWVRQQLKEGDSFLSNAQVARRRIITGSFDGETEAQFAEMLDYFGRSPIIVRSSSLLEDNYGNSFAGKYESVFCANQGSRQQRMEDFVAAVKTIYASSISEEALAYRARRGLLDQDEQMALLVQRVSGSKQQNLFFPQVAGVGFSYNLFSWSEEIDPEAGILRLVYGLGTRAVDRMDNDYTRLVALNAPMRLPDAIEDGMPSRTQQKVDVIDLQLNQLSPKDFNEILDNNPGHPVSTLFATRSETMAKQAQERGLPASSVRPVITFKGLLSQTSFAQDMREMLRILQDAYECPVDIEFTANMRGENDYKINLVQCRPLQMRANALIEEGLEHIPEPDKLIETGGPVLGRGRVDRIARIIYVAPSAYAALSIRAKHSIARLIGEIVHLDVDPEAGPIMLLGPGRWGTTTPSLGVAVSFYEIEKVTYIGEIIEMGDNPAPEISLGTHFFSEMVEMDMLYMAIMPKDKNTIFNRDLLENAPNKLPELLPESAQYAEVVRVIDTAEMGDGTRIMIHADTVAQKVVCYLAKPRD